MRKKIIYKRGLSTDSQRGKGKEEEEEGKEGAKNEKRKG